MAGDDLFPGQREAADLRGGTLPCGHCIAGQAPDDPLWAAALPERGTGVRSRPPPGAGASFERY